MREETTIYGDQAYWKEADRQDFEASGVRYRVNRRPAGKQPLSERWRRINRARSRIRARGEHPFHIVKRLWGFERLPRRLAVPPSPSGQTGAVDAIRVLPTEAD